MDTNRKPAGKRSYTDDSRGRKPFVKKEQDDKGGRKPYVKREPEDKGGRKPYVKREQEDKKGERRRFTKDLPRKSVSSRPKDSGVARESRNPRENDLPSGPIRLNKYISNAGICSRREADKLIEAGAIKVNGIVVTELGTKISLSDKVQYGDQSLSREKLRYVLLNKPKGFITTADDPEDRKTVMHLVENACKERIYPVGRLDRNTTGLLLLTNDGELAKRLTHPRYGIKKIYHVMLDHNLAKTDMVKIEAGIELEDGLIKVDAIEYVGDGKDKKELGIELHSGKNRIVRRIFEQLEYKVVKLDRVGFAGLTKKNLSRGEWRFLEEKEIGFLKMTSTDSQESKVKSRKRKENDE